MVTLSKREGGLGIRNARDNNIAMLGKLSWHIIAGSDKLWVQMLTSKYLQRDHLTEHSPSRLASPVCKSITRSFN